MEFLTLLGFSLVVSGALLVFHALIDYNSTIFPFSSLGWNHPIRFRKSLKKKTFYIGGILVILGLVFCILAAQL